MHTHLRYEVAEGIATITLNRPEAYNAINEAISYELQDALKQATRDAAVRVLVLTGAGKAFCSGQDLKEIAGKTDRSLAESLHKRYNPIIRAMRAMPKPIIAQVNGVAAGAGASLALAADYIVAGQSASFIQVFVNIGLVPDSGSSWFLVQRLGVARAFALASLGSKVPAQQAADMGMINETVEDERLAERVAALAAQYAAGPTRAYGLMKKMLDKAATTSLNDALEYEALCQEIAGRSADYREGVAAFNEKRKPAYTGQ